MTNGEYGSQRPLICRGRARGMRYMMSMMKDELKRTMYLASAFIRPGSLSETTMITYGNDYGSIEVISDDIRSLDNETSRETERLLRTSTSQVHHSCATPPLPHILNPSHPSPDLDTPTPPPPQAHSPHPPPAQSLPAALSQRPNTPPQPQPQPAPRTLAQRPLR